MPEPVEQGLTTGSSDNNPPVEETKLDHKDALKMARSHIAFAALVLALSMLVGYLNPESFDPLLEEIKTLATKIQDKSAVSVTLFIFINNMKAALVAVILGPLLGIVPTLQVAANGVIIGIVVEKASASVGVHITLLGLVPHGVFEIPAMVISWGLGIWLGMWPFNRGGLRFLDKLLLAARAMLRYVVPLLAIAALIEGLLIYALSKG